MSSHPYSTQYTVERLWIPELDAGTDKTGEEQGGFFLGRNSEFPEYERAGCCVSCIAIAVQMRRPDSDCVQDRSAV